MNTCENLDSFEVAEEASQVCVLSPHSTVVFLEAASFPKLALAPQGCAAAVSKRLAIQPASPTGLRNEQKVRNRAMKSKKKARQTDNRKKRERERGRERLIREMGVVVR